MDYKDRKYKRSRNYIDSFKHAFTGIKTAILEERNLRFHFCAAIVVIGLGFFFAITRLEWLVLTLCIFAVFVTEMVNTAIERAVDVATERFMSEAKKAKDIAAGAVLLVSICAIIIGSIIFIPHIIHFY